MNTPRFRSYDYVEDDDGWIYLVKGCIAKSGESVGKAMYTPPPERLKCKTRYPDEIAPPRTPHYPFAGPMDHIVPFDRVRRAFSRVEIRLDTLRDANEDFHKIVTIARRYGAEPYLFGSRRLGIHASDSDWDILVVSCGTPSALIDDIVISLEGRARRFNIQESTERAQRYAKPAGPLSFECLARLFPLSTLYLKYDGGEIGVFFGDDSNGQIPDPAAIAAKTETTISGRLFVSNGLSHCMPRRFNLVTAEGTAVKIRTILWELGGIEELKAEPITVKGLRQLDDETWWLGGPTADIEFAQPLS